jgi:hypothetical protein
VILPGYTVTRDGRIKSPSGKWVTISTGTGGNLRFTRRDDGVSRTVNVGRLVCETFHGPAPSRSHVVIYIDGDRSNVHADNLRWGTRAEAAQVHGHREHPTQQGELHHEAVLTWSKVHSIRQEYAAGGVSQRALARKYGVSSVSIHHILHNNNWVDPGYTPPMPRRPRKATPS